MQPRSKFGFVRYSSKFEDPLLENSFMVVYRQSGLRLAKIAFITGSGMLFTFWWLLLWFPVEVQASEPRQAVRIGLALILLAAAANLHIRPERAVRNYLLSIGIPMAIGCLIAGALGFVPLDSGNLAVNRFVVGITLACWLCYGFSRLPVGFIAAVCIPTSLLTLFSLMLQGDDHVLALGVYLIVANVIGCILSIESERRERALFLSVRELSEAKTKSETMAREAFEADTAKTRALAAVSHDLRQPLASLTLYTQHLREQQGGCSAASSRTLDRLEACIGAISSDLDRISELGLRERGSPLPVEKIDLRCVLERIERVYSGLAARAGARLVVRVPTAGEYSGISNESRLWDVFANLVGNALKFATPDRQAWVLVRVRVRHAGLEVVIRDNGIGIDASDQRRVFDEYFQVANRSRSVKQGQGLGLSIVRETVARLPGHSIRLSSSLSTGTCFALYIPGTQRRSSRPAGDTVRRRTPSFVSYPLPGDALLQAPAQRVSDTDAIADSVVRTRRPFEAERSVSPGDACVLVVEDDEVMCDALRHTFERWGFDVRCAQSGEDAIELTMNLQRMIDAIVCDFRLPGAWDGLRLIDELRRLEGGRTPAILLSGEFRVDALLCDAPDDVCVMAKPPDVVRLRELLGNARRRVSIDPV